MDFSQQLYSTISNSAYYESLLADLFNCRSDISNRVLFQFRDRGNKFDFVWDYDYSPNQSNGFKLRHSQETSFYKTWLQIRMNPLISFSIDDVKECLLSSNSELILKLAQHNYRECYAIAMILFEVINRVYFQQVTYSKSDIFYANTYELIRIMTLYALTYAKYHSERDVLKTVDVISNYARVFDVFKNQSLITLFDAKYPNGAGVKFVYIWAMMFCYKQLPTYIPIKLHYLKCARMMHQNQTVGIVVNDAMETSFSDCQIIGQQVTNLLLSYYEDEIISNGFLIDYDKYNNEIEYLKKEVATLEIKEESFCRLQYLNKIIQIEDFNGCEICRPTYKPAPIHYTFFLKQLHISEENIQKIQLRPECIGTDIRYSIFIQEPLLGKTIMYSNTTYHKLDKMNQDNTPSFRDVVLFLDEKQNLITIMLTGNHLYAIKKDIDWTNLFYGIPCIVTTYDLSNTLYENRLQISVFGNSQAIDEVVFDTRFNL